LFQPENRFGIGRNPAWVTEPGLLYEAEFIRPAKDVGLLVEMEGYDHADWQRGILQLGGESRASSYQKVSVEGMPASKIPLGRFKLYFATPAYFSGGWLPATPTTWSDLFKGNIKFLAAALRGYDTIGGFDRVKDPESHAAHRASRRYVPAGSVYYFENEQDTELSIDSLTEGGADLGFGRFIVSPIKGLWCINRFFEGVVPK
jgi:CRISPR-associated protein Cmr3